MWVELIDNPPASLIQAYQDSNNSVDSNNNVTATNRLAGRLSQRLFLPEVDEHFAETTLPPSESAVS